MVFLVPYAYDRMPYGKPKEGVSTDKLGTKARCDALVRIQRQAISLKPGSRFVLSAGFSKESPKVPDTIIFESLADQMERYLLSQGVHPADISARAESWGTYQETKVAVHRITAYAEFNFVNNPLVFVCTNPGHMPRVRLCWLFLKPRGWRVRFVTANHSFTRKEWFQETAKFFQYLYKFVLKKW